MALTIYAYNRTSNRCAGIYTSQNDVLADAIADIRAQIVAGITQNGYKEPPDWVFKRAIPRDVIIRFWDPDNT